MLVLRVKGCLCAVAVVGVLANRVHAQERPSWEFEVHAGGLFNARQGDGAGSLPSTGEMIGGQISVASFFFGEGARMVNQNQASVLGGGAAAITPLDPVLLGSTMQWQRTTGGIGVRVSRSIRRSLAFEFSLDYERTTLELTGAALAGVEQTRASVERSLAQALATAAVPSAVSVVAAADTPRRGSQVAAMGAVVAHARERSRLTPFVVFGGGVIFNRVDAPSATLTARYELGTTGEVVGTNAVTLGYQVNSMEYSGIVGGGVKYRLAPRWGLRLDARARLLPNNVVNHVATESSVVRRSTGSPFPLVNIGSLQFSSTAPLTGVPIADAATFTSGGLAAHMTAGLGFFWRF